MFLTSQHAFTLETSILLQVYKEALTRILWKWFNLRSPRWYVVVPKCIRQRNTDTICNCGCKWVCVLHEEKWGDRIIAKIELEKDMTDQLSFFFFSFWFCDEQMRGWDRFICMPVDKFYVSQWNCHRFAGKFKVSWERDPLSLFILVMEALSKVLNWVKTVGYLKEFATSRVMG